MFDIGFSEIVLISIVALLVLGPEKLPEAIRTASLWIGRFRRSFDNIKRDIEREIGADEIRRQLRNEAILDKFNESKKQLTESLRTVQQEAESIKKEADSVGRDLSGKTAAQATNDQEAIQAPAPEADDNKGFGAPPPPPDASPDTDNIDQEARVPVPEPDRRAEDQ